MHCLAGVSAARPAGLGWAGLGWAAGAAAPPWGMLSCWFSRDSAHRDKGPTQKLGTSSAYWEPADTVGVPSGRSAHRPPDPHAIRTPQVHAGTHWGATSGTDGPKSLPS